MILKVQRPMMSNGDGQEHYFYNESRSVEFVRRATDAERKALGEDWKMYAEYKTNGHGALKFIERVDPQGW